MGRSHLKASIIDEISVPVDIETNLFQNLSEKSSLTVPPNSVQVGDVFRLKVIFSVDPIGTSTTRFSLTHRHSDTFVTISPASITTSTSQYFAIECDITFNTLTTANVMWSVMGTSENSFSYFRNVSWDETLSQTFGLSAISNNHDGMTVYEVQLSKLTFD